MSSRAGGAAPGEGLWELSGLPADVSDPFLDALPAAMRHLRRTDPLLASVLAECPPPARAWEATEPFDALVGSLVHQQVSIQAGRAIYARVLAACGDAITPASLLAAGPEKLRAAGLSGSKTAYALDLAQKTASGEVDFARIAVAPDEEVVETLTRVKGIGPWTAKMFLLFHLSRPDVFAPEDLGLQIAVAELYGVPRERTRAKMEEMRKAWSPYNSLVALTLWNWRRVREERTPPAAKPANAVKAAPPKKAAKKATKAPAEAVKAAKKAVRKAVKKAARQLARKGAKK